MSLLSVASVALAALVLPLSPSPAPAWSPRPSWRRAPPAVMGAREAGRRSSRVAQVVRSELATVLRQDSVRGPKRCPGKVRQMISLVDIDVSPDLRNARVKFSVLGDRQDKVTATRWVLGNAGGIRMALAGRLRQMKRVPALNFQHVDVGKAVDVMVLLDQLSNERLGGGGGGGGTGDDLDFEASEDDAFGDGEGEAELTETADEAAFGFATTASEDELFDGEDEDDGDDFDLAEFGLAGER